jgi:hypothetical protein
MSYTTPRMLTRNSLEALRSGLERELNLGDPSVVDEDVDAAEGADLLGQLLGTFGVNVVDGEVGAVGGQPERDGPADSPRRAGDDGHLPVDAAHGTYLLVGASSGW